MVLYGYSKSGDGEEESQGHALSGLQLGNKLRHGEITCGFIFPFYIYIYIYIYIYLYIYIYISFSFFKSFSALFTSMFNFFLPTFPCGEGACKR